jgi:hypothetical protein
MQQHARSTERRRVQRVHLPQPLRATIDGTKVFLVDVSVRGLRVMHQEDIGSVASECVVRTEWDGHSMTLHCTIVRTAMHHPANRKSDRTLYHSGLAIDHATTASERTLRRLVEHHVERALDEQKANARGIPPPLAAQSMKTGTPTTYVRHEYVMGRWREVMTAISNQPDNGFTICATTTPAEVEMLRRAYETATSAADLAMIRRMAALSVSAAEVVQARRYTP